MGDDAAGGFRRALPAGSTGLVLGLEALALVVGNVFLRFPLWATMGFAVVAWWLLAQFKSVAAACMVSNAWLGAAFSELLFGFSPWVTSVAACVAVALASLGYTKGGEASESGHGDPNVVPFIVAIVATRAFLSLKYAGVFALSPGVNIFQWLGLVVLGDIPGAPVVVNVLFVLGLQGTLLIYLVLVLKREVNPVAN
jgi:hypothetical protein